MATLPPLPTVLQMSHAAALDDKDPDDLPKGTKIGAYVVESMIGSGGGGAVFLAEDPTNQRRVAIKMLRAEIASSKEAVARFLREARVLNMIRHPAIVEVFEFSQMPDGRPYFVMELLEGSDLRRLITSRGRFSPEEILEIVAPVCSALTAAHSAGVVHRDLKASNINVVLKDGRYLVKLLDFGIAKLLQEQDRETAGLTRAGARLGTATSMAPEQIRGEAVDHRTDIYALGILIYHMLTGRYPFRGGTPQETDRLSLEATAPRPSQLVPVPPELDAVVLRCLDKVPSRRYESASAVEEALRQAVLGSAPVNSIPGARQVAAIYVEACSDNTPDESDEHWLDDLVQVLDRAEQAFERAGLSILLQTATSLLGARILSEDFNVAREEAADMRDVAALLYQELAARALPHTNLHAEVRIHVGAAEVQGSPQPNIVGGPIVDIASWPDETNVKSSSGF